MCTKNLRMTRLTLLFLLIFCIKISNAQNVTADKNLTQKLLLHLSKNTCNAGEVVAFKYYVINNINHLEDDHNLYILLTDKKGTILSKEKYPLFNSSANGFITIPKELEAGSYYLQAFTPYMINNKIIKSTPLMVNTLQSGAYDLPILCNIFYDNKKLISNIPNTFFIKTAFSNGLPAPCDVTLTDKDDKQLKGFTTDNNGVAKITFTPLKNQHYTLSINNKKFLYPLIKPDSNGVNMQVSFEKNVLNFMLTKNYKIQPKEDSFSVVVYQNNSEVYKAAFSFENYASITSGVNIASLPTGIIRLVLQDKDRNVVSATSIYVQNKNNFDDIILTKEIIPTNNSLQATISFPSKANKYLSVSVEKINAKDSILTDDGDYFYSANVNATSNQEIIYFFELSPNPNSTMNAPYKILKTNLKIQAKNRDFPKIADDYATIIRGKVFDPTGEKFYGSGFLNFLYETPDSVYKYTAKVKPDGSFTLDSLVFYGIQKFTYKYYTTANKELASSLKLTENKNNSLLDSLLTYDYGFILKDKIVITSVSVDSNLTKAKTLDEVKIKSGGKPKSKAEVVNDLFTTGIYSTQSSIFIDNINNPPNDTKMRGVQFVKNRVFILQVQNGNFVNTRNFSLQNAQPWVVGITIDEIPAGLSDLDQLNVDEIALVKFFDVGHITVGMINPGGLLAVYTKGNKSKISVDKLTSKPTPEKVKPQEFDYEGFGNNVVLFSEKDKNVNAYKSAYWNPSIILLKDQNNFSFNTDKIKAANSYKISIKGYNELGKLINVETIIKN